MKTLLKKNKKVSILPQDVQGAAEGTIKKALKDFFEVEIPQEDLKYYKTGEIVELFAAVDAGMLYFSSELEEINENLLKIKTAKDYELLQRREYTRIPLDREIKIKDDNSTCKCIDISAGGMKIEMAKQPDMEKDYTISFSLDGRTEISCYLRPIRISKDDKKKNGKYIVSGRFVLLKNIDKIAIVQYCFKKNIENTNK